MPRLPKTLSLFLIASLLPLLAVRAQQAAPETKKEAPAAKKDAKPSTNPIDRIKEEGLQHSKVMETLSYLTDVIGPRLTGSPGIKRANTWTRDRLSGWGLENAHLEPWGKFGRGWSLKRFSAQVVEPQCIPLIAYPKAWSPGTGGPLELRRDRAARRQERSRSRQIQGKAQGRDRPYGPSAEPLCAVRAAGHAAFRPRSA